MHSGPVDTHTSSIHTNTAHSNAPHSLTIQCEHMRGCWVCSELSHDYHFNARIRGAAPRRKFGAYAPFDVLRAKQNQTRSIVRLERHRRRMDDNARHGHGGTIASSLSRIATLHNAESNASVLEERAKDERLERQRYGELEGSRGEAPEEKNRAGRHRMPSPAADKRSAQKHNGTAHKVLTVTGTYHCRGAVNVGTTV